MKKIPPQTTSFAILFSFVLVGTFISMLVSGSFPINAKNKNNDQTAKTNKDYEAVSYKTANSLTNQKITETSAPQKPAVDTSNWKTYSNPKYLISFLYDPSWKVLPTVLKDGYTVITIDPGKKFDNIKIYISSNSFFAMENLPYVKDAVDGYETMNVQDILYGVKANKLFYTIDQGSSVSISDKFQALVKSINLD